MSHTSILGILTIVGAIVNAAMQYFTGHTVDYGTTFAGIAGGVGLIRAADAGTTVKQTTTTTTASTTTPSPTKP